MELPSYMKEAEWVRIGRLVFEVALAFSGVLGNIAVILAVGSRPFMQSVTNIFIRNLAVADLGLLLFSFPLAVIKEQTLFRWPLGPHVCQIIYPLSEVFLGVSSWSMAIIAVDRYRGIVNDSHVRSLNRARYICVVPWVVSFLVLSLPLLVVTRYWEGWGIKDCIHEWPMEYYNAMNQAYVLIAMVYTYLTPLGIIIWTYWMIFRKLGKSTAFNTAQGRKPTRHDEARIKRNTRAKRILTPVVVVFGLSMLPVTVFRLVMVYIPSLVYYHYLFVLYNICMITTVINSSANPFIYAIVSDNFRKAFKSMCRVPDNLHRGGRRIYGQLSSVSGNTTMGLRTQATRLSRLSTITSEDQSPVLDERQDDEEL
ncbi:neuropeptide Y receptor type 2 [Nematostella vectensis]|uniref:neuropeptide Y receptor type 2 n=1 Tax=Nematostella vectensis TaxID=45351 RepID=UPI00138FD8AB|nr:neuropeptide Y receptor type 2 [Nematostella vectensis]